MATIKTVYKDKPPEQVDFEITADEGSTLSITMSGGAVTVIITSTGFYNEYKSTDKPPLLKKGKYSMKVGKTAAVTNIPTVTIKF